MPSVIQCREQYLKVPQSLGLSLMIRQDKHGVYLSLMVRRYAGVSGSFYLTAQEGKTGYFLKMVVTEVNIKFLRFEEIF